MMYLKKGSILLICIALLVCLAAAGTAFAEGGWATEKNPATGEYERIYLDDHGNHVTGWRTIDEKRYYFDENGYMVYKGWNTIDGGKYYLNPYAYTGFCGFLNEDGRSTSTYFFDSNGKMLTGWITSNSHLYYLGEDGKRAAGGWLTLGSDRYFLYTGGDPYALTGSNYLYNQETKEYEYYYFDEKGRMQTGWVTIDGKKYYYGEDGKRVSGWLTLGEDKYYIGTSGYAVTGRYYVSGDSATYYFNTDGKMQTGWVTLDETDYDAGKSITVKRKYYYGSDGKEASGLVKIGGDTYGFSPYLQTGSFTVYYPETKETAYYYSNEEGKLQTGWVTINGKRYYYGKDGKRQTGWITDGEDKYYLEPFQYGEYYASARTGLCYISNEDGTFYFDPDGKMRTGFVDVEETDYTGNAVTRTYYFGKDGKRQTGWVTVDGDTYYLNYALMTGLTAIYDETEQKSWYYYFDDKGKMQTGLVRAEITDNSGNTTARTYYFGSDGRAVTGWQQVGPDWYYFSEYGCYAYTGLIYVKGDCYMFSETGVMQTGWCDTGKSDYGWRLFSSSGAMLNSFEGMSSVTIPSAVTNLKPNVFSGIGRDFVIYCEPGSYAEKFAIRNGIQYSNGQKDVIGYQISSVSEKVKWVVDNYTTPEMSDLEKVRALHDWLIHNAHYDTTYTTHAASGVLLNGSGVCESYARAYELLLNAAGIENKYISGKADNGSGSGPQGHAWNMVKLGDNWYHVDCTWDDPTDLEKDVPIISGWEGYNYFLISDDTIGANHSWSSSVKAYSDMLWLGDPGWTAIEGGGWIYYDADGFLVTGAARIDGTLYGFTTDGFLISSGWLDADGNYYYAAADGILMENDWLLYGGTWYYLGQEGRMATGWQYIGGVWYCFSDSGAMQTGWVEDGGTWYYMDSSGAMATGWQEINGSWYYLSSTGVMQTGWVKDGGSWYYLDSSGAMATGWLENGGTWYYMGSSGAMATGWQEIGGSWYYLSGSGAMQTGWLKDGGAWYYLSGSGRMATGWQEIGGSWYYMTSGGAMVTGAQIIDGRQEVFADTGVWLYTSQE